MNPTVLDEGAERRRHPRLAIGVGVHCNSFQEGKISHVLSDVSQDLSAGGLSLRSDRPLETGLKVLVSFFLPLRSRSLKMEPRVSLPVIARARVAWCRPESADYRLGIEFLDINPYSRRIFKSFLDFYHLDYGPLPQGS